MYKAIYREYRPKTFDEVLGQDHITKTLKNQIKLGNISHAYLFSGERGTGKTSTAKVFARAVNCENPIEGNPCNVCESCKLSLNDETLDILEMDAASNRSIANIRNLTEMVGYAPSHLKYKVYIIDEVHMISNEAFNALLKTLEEPPGYVVFILATTEPEKLPETILSRCQRFDYRRVGAVFLQENILRILSDIGKDIDKDALNLIVSNAEGSVRDSLSLLDRLVGFSDDVITYEDTLEVLGSADRAAILNLTKSVLDGDSKGIIKMIDTLVNSGKDVYQLYKDLTREVRNLLVVKIMGEASKEILFLSDEDFNSCVNVIKNQDAGKLNGIFTILTEKENSLKWSSQARYLLEAYLLTINDTTETTLINTNSDKKTETLPPATESDVVKSEVRGETEESKEIVSNVNTVDIKGAWQAFMGTMGGMSRSVMLKLKPVDFKDNVLYLSAENVNDDTLNMVFSKDKIQDVEQAMEPFFGEGSTIRIQGKSDVARNEGKKLKSDKDKIIEYFGKENINFL